MRGTQPPSNLSKAASRTAGALLAIGAGIVPVEALARPRSEAAPFVQAVPQTPDPLLVIVSLRKQRLSVFNKNGHVTESPISSGTAEFPTPTGVFSVIGKAVEHESNLYEGASMPFMQRLTWTGTAMHAGHLPGYPASHGCIRLPYAFAEKLYSLTNINTRVIVSRDDVAPQSISHAKLFVPLVAPVVPADLPMAGTVSSRVASLAGIAPAMAAPVSATVLAPGQLPLTANARMRFLQTAALFGDIRKAETARAAVWEQVKSANRALEFAKSGLNAHQNAIDAAVAEIESARRAKLAAQSQLGSVIRKAQNARSPAALLALSAAEDAAEDRLLAAIERLDAAHDKVVALRAGLADFDTRVQTAEAGRRALDDSLRESNQALKNAQSSFALSKREDARYMKPVSVLVSRKDQRLYVRQGFEPVLEVPIVIANPDQRIGTHVFTAMGVTGGAQLEWTVVSLDGVDRDEEPRRGKARSLPTQPATSASRALDRIEFPAEALEAISDVVKPGSSLIISDESTSQYFGNGTDFTVAAR